MDSKRGHIDVGYSWITCSGSFRAGSRVADGVIVLRTFRRPSSADELSYKQFIS